MQNDNNENIIEAARDYIRRGLAVVPIPFRSKKPVLNEWQNLKISEAELPKYFNGKPQNIGVMLGEKSGGLVDIDLDSPEAVKLADWFLPKTKAIFGRKGKPASHRLYICKDAEYAKFNNPLLLASKDKDEKKKACIVEIRTSKNGKGIQTVFPPSVHESGERIEWQENGEPERVSAAELEKAVGKTAAAALLAKCWREGIRHDLAMAVSGALLRHGFTKDEVRHFIKAICTVADDAEMADRLQVVEDTAKALGNGEKAFGLPKLAELTDEKIVKAICEWLEIEGTNQPIIENSFAKLPNRESAGKDSHSNTRQQKEPLKRLKTVKMSDIEAQTVEWLWKDYIPLGAFTIVEGEEELGKTWIVCTVAGATAQGYGLPNNPKGEPANVLMMSAEDSLAFVIKPRLEAVKAPCERIFAIDEHFTFDKDGILRLEFELAEHAPKLVIIDPLFSYTGKINLNNDNEIRSVTDELTRLAEKYECAIVGVRHIGKSKGMGDPRNAGLNGIGWRASARVVLLVGKDPNDERQRAIVQTKNNLAPRAEKAIGYEIIGNEFFWKESTLTARTMLSLPKSDEERGEQSEAVVFLRETLKDGKCKTETVKRQALKLGITEQRLRTARAKLGIKPFSEGFTDKKWYWKLPENARVDVDKTSEDVDNDNNQHLRANDGDKTSYSNDLPVDVDTPENQHLRAENQHLREPDAQKGKGFDLADYLINQQSQIN